MDKESPKWIKYMKDNSLDKIENCDKVISICDWLVEESLFTPSSALFEIKLQGVKITEDIAWLVYNYSRFIGIQHHHITHMNTNKEDYFGIAKTDTKFIELCEEYTKNYTPSKLGLIEEFKALLRQKPEIMDFIIEMSIKKSISTAEGMVYALRMAKYLYDNDKE